MVIDTSFGARRLALDPSVSAVDAYPDAPLPRWENRRLRLVRRILARERVDETELGYPLDMFHLAAVARGPEAAATVAAAQAAWKGLSLKVCEDLNTAWLWLAAGSSASLALGRGTKALEATRLAIGGPAEGREGFIESHRQATVALRLGTHAGRPVRYEQVALVELLVQNRMLARRFVGRELGDLDREDAPGKRDRATLRAYLDCRGNAVSAAAILHLHRNSLRARLERIEARLGKPVDSRRTELDAALRVRELYRRDYVLR